MLDISDLPKLVAFDGAKEFLMSAAGATLVIVAFQAWTLWGKGKLGNHMLKKQREKDDLLMVQQHIAGAMDYMLKDGLITPQRLWAILPKFDSIPGLRNEMLSICKKHMPKVEEEPNKTTANVHKLRSLKL